MLWLSRKCNVDNRKLTLAKGLCAETVKHLMKDPRSIAAVEAAIKYGNGEIDDTELRNAAADAAAADAAAAAAYAAYAADAAAYAAAYGADAAAYAAAYAANAAADAAYAAADAAYAANAAAYAAYAAAARKKSQLQTAEIVRNTISIKDLNLT